jgi:multisubunit Na+/H+ antiporter MnhC subunit|nr:DnaJ domain-containing protein [Aliihoeflea aestuarii]
MMLYVITGVAVALGLFYVFMRADAAKIALSLRLVGPIVLAIFGAGMMLIGRVGIGGMALSAALGWYGAGRVRRNARPTPGKRSHVRTAALEMELDHDSGELDGVVRAGAFDGRALGDLSEEQLFELHAELQGDGESRQLLEAYLDGRLPLWRENPQADVGGGETRAPASGPMTKQEAYQVLGLEPGAGAADIRKAHRRLMQKLHPDLGGSSFLAARINEAKDVLLSTHG